MKDAIPDTLMTLALLAGAWFVAVAPGDNARNVIATLLIFAALRFGIDAARAIKKAWDDSPGVFP